MKVNDKSSMTASISKLHISSEGRRDRKSILKLAPLEKQGGIALIQILIIVAILTTVALYISKSAKQQVQMAQWAVDRTYAAVSAHSAQADVMFEMLTSTWGANTIASMATSEEVGTEFDFSHVLNSGVNSAVGSEISEDNKQQSNYNQSLSAQNPSAQNETFTNINNQQQAVIAVPWNLYNQAFMLNSKVSVQLQDQAGLINLHHPAVGIVAARLRYQGVSSDEALRAQATLLDWQDGDSIRRNYGAESDKNTRNHVMPDKREWLLQKTITAEQLQLITDDFTLYGAGHLNLLTSPKSILASLSNDAVADEIVKRREQYAQQMHLGIDPLTGQFQSNDNNSDVNMETTMG